MGSTLLAEVRLDLADVIKVCEGALKQTNRLRSLMSHLNKGMSHLCSLRVSPADTRSAGTIPTHWIRYKVPRSMGVAQWIPDFAARLAQLEGISQMESFIGVKVWLGGLFFPEAYVTATRQAVAQRNSWSLETLYLNLDIDQPDDNSAFEVEGMSR